MNKPRIELRIIYGEYGEKSKTLSLQISESLERELMEGVELSDPLTLVMASPGIREGKDQRIFEMRKHHAEEIARLMVPALIELFGVDDKHDGYSKDTSL